MKSDGIINPTVKNLAKTQPEPIGNVLHSIPAWLDEDDPAVLAAKLCKQLCNVCPLTPHVLGSRNSDGSRCSGLSSDLMTTNGDYAADEARGKLGKAMLRSHNFFANLNDNERRLFALVTEDIPMNKLAGLQTIARRVWNGRERRTVASFIFMIGQLLLNCYVSFYSLQIATGGNVGWRNDVILKPESLTICSQRLKFDPTDKSKLGNSSASDTLIQGCVVAPYLTSAMWPILLITEACIVLTFIVTTVVCALTLFLTRNPSRVAAAHYFTFMAVPRVSCKFSLLMFIHMATFSRLVSLFFRGDIRCMLAIWKGSFLRGAKFLVSTEPVDLEDGTASDDYCEYMSLKRSKKSERTPIEWRWDLLTVSICLIFIVASFHILLMKLSIIYFAGLFSPYGNWDVREYILFFGFVNQLSGLSLATEVEMFRLLLFKFGGEESVWTPEEIEACDIYLRYLAVQAVEQLGRMRSLMVLWTLDAEKLQRLFLGHARAQEQHLARRKSLEVYMSLDSKDRLVKLRDKLVDRFGRIVTDFPGKLTHIPADKRLEVCNYLQAKAIGELRLAAKVQEFVWEWEKDLLGYGTKTSAKS